MSYGLGGDAVAESSHSMADLKVVCWTHWFSGVPDLFRDAGLLENQWAGQANLERCEGFLGEFVDRGDGGGKAE